MTLLRSCLPVFACCVLLIQCTSSRDEMAGVGALFPFKPQPPVQPIRHPDSYIGKWSYSFPFYGRGLLIKEDSTFVYHSQSCLGHWYSEGTLTGSWMGIVLTSSKRYANNRSSGDTSFVYFKGAPLRIEGDTLFEIDNKGSGIGSKYVQLKYEGE
jgi:hypothetical protein